MTESTLEKELHQRMGELSPSQQREVLRFAEELAKSRPKGTPGKDLLRFAGTISPEDAEEMRRAIEEDCERIDPDEW